MRLGRWREVAAVALAALACAPAAARANDCVLVARLHWIDVEELAPFAYDGAAREAAGLLERHGVCADMSQADPSAVRGPGEIGIILLRSMGAAGEGRRVMGAVRVGGGASVYVYVDEVTAALGYGHPRETWTTAERLHLARALGRVAAHEVIHALLPGRPHDGSGLMAATLGRRELTVPVLAPAAGLRAEIRRSVPSGSAAKRSWVASS